MKNVTKRSAASKRYPAWVEDARRKETISGTANNSYKPNSAKEATSLFPPPSELGSKLLTTRRHDYKLGSENMSLTSSGTETDSRVARRNGHLTLHADAAVTPKRPEPMALNKVAAPVSRDLSAPNFGNDFSNNFVFSGVLPQNYIQNIDEPFREYPKLQRLHELKEQHYDVHAEAPIGIRCPAPRIPSLVQQLHNGGAQFDVVMVNGCISEFSMAQLEALQLDLITPRPSLLYLWVPAPLIAEGRQLMERWGFRHGEDVTYMVNSLDSAHAPRTNAWKPQRVPLFTQTTWHCLMGLKGTLRRSTDTNLIHCNTDTDVIIEQSHSRRNVVPEQIYGLVENFTSMKRKLHIVPSSTPGSLPVRPRKGWVVVSPNTFSVGDFKLEKFKHRTLIPAEPEISILRPQTPPAQQR